MRVLHIGKYYPPFSGGIENFCGDLLPALEEVGVNTAALVHQHSGGQRGTPAKNIIRVPSYGRLLYTPVCPGFPLALSRILRNFRPNLLHIHMPNASAFWLLVSAQAHSIPWLIHWHSDVVPSTLDTRLAWAYKFYRPFEQQLLQLADHIICTSPNYLDSSAPLQKWKDKCKIVPLGLNPQRLPITIYDQQVKKKADIFWPKERNLRLLSIGRLTYYKGHELLIKAAKETKSATIVIVGTGERFPHIQQAIHRFKLSNRVQLTGHLPDDQLHALMQSADCICLPSLERTEAFGLVLLEAMRYGKATIATSVDGAGMNWLVNHKKTGILVPPGDEKQLAKAIHYMADNPDKRVEMGQAGQKKFTKQLHIRKIALNIKQIYNKILST